MAIIITQYLYDYCVYCIVRLASRNETVADWEKEHPDLNFKKILFVFKLFYRIELLCLMPLFFSKYFSHSLIAQIEMSYKIA